MASLPLRCRCGHVRGLAAELSPRAGNHLICYCEDCQTFAAFLGSSPGPDAFGGTAIFQLPPAQVSLESGTDALACVRLSSKGMYRWYASCCRTPLANTLGPGVPFVGLVLSCLAPEETPRSTEALLGPPVRVEGRSARSSAPAGTHAGVPAGFLLKAAVRLLKWKLSGRATPSPFFIGGVPRVAPLVLAPAERERLRSSTRAPSWHAPT